MVDRPHYTPTAGMLRILTAALAGEPVSGLDAYRCRRRGLLDLQDRATAAGHFTVAREQRRAGEVRRG